MWPVTPSKLAKVQFLLLIIGFCLLSGFGIWKFFQVEKPGEGLKAKKGVEVGGQIISAIDRYKSKNNIYPKELKDLMQQI